MKNKKIKLVELLAVIAILAVVLFVVLGNLEGAKQKREARQLQQIYVAAMLYKGDNDNKLPESLVTLRTTNYLPAQALTNPNDARIGIKVADWPANPWMHTPFFGDPPRITHARFKELNSYAFLPTWKTRYHYKKPFEEFMEEPNRGLVTGLGLMKCQTIVGFANCKYFNGDPLIDSGQPATTLIGTIMSVRVDGAIVTRHRQPPVSGDMSLEGLFFLNDLAAGKQTPIRSSTPTPSTKGK